jgi:hypothetical protein
LTLFRFAQPFPFVYVSFVYVICLLYPVLFSAAAALSFTTPGTTTLWSHEAITFMAVLLNTTFFTGLQGIAARFQGAMRSRLRASERLSRLSLTRLCSLTDAPLLSQTPSATITKTCRPWTLCGSRAW